MKAKNHRTQRNNNGREEILPHEAGTHLFALIKRNLLARREKAPAQPPSQLTFAF